MKFFVAYFIIFAPFFAKTNALKCLVCDSIYQSADSACQLRDCDEYSKEWLEYEDKIANEDGKLNSEDQVSLKAYYRNMTKLENSLKKKSENTNDGGKFFDLCISKLGVYDGKRVKMKACGRKKWESCKNDKDRKIFESCSTCETDYCNTLQCYSCGGRLDGDNISHISPCNDNTLQNICYGDHIKCFSATGVKNGEKVEYRGCIYENETEISWKFFEKEALSHHFCEKNLCNEESLKSMKRDDQNSYKNTHRYKKSQEYDEYLKEEQAYQNSIFKCLVCEGIAVDGPCALKRCQDVMNSTKKFNCLSAKGTINGELRVYKTCTYEGSNQCEDLKQKGYGSCSTCVDSSCNVLKCFLCGGYMGVSAEFKKFQSCKSTVPYTCDHNNHLNSCYSAKTSLNGKDVWVKNCIMKPDIQSLTEYLASYGFSYYICDSNLCNNDKYKDNNLFSKKIKIV